MWWIVGVCGGGFLLIVSTTVGVFSQPWSAWWFATDVATIPAGPSTGTNPPPPSVHGGGGISDLQRYGLARAAGWNPQDAIIATAISIAEDGSGDPAALSPFNRDGSRDLGIFQINSAWWPLYGGQAALSNPVVNALAAFSIYGKQGFCAWSTWEVRCGPGHDGSYRAHLDRARAAAQGG